MNLDILHLKAILYWLAESISAFKMGQNLMQSNTDPLLECQRFLPQLMLPDGHAYLDGRLHNLIIEGKERR